MPRSPAVNGLIVAIVIAFVGGVAWYKSQQRDEATASVEPAVAVPEQPEAPSPPRPETPRKVEPTPKQSLPPKGVEPVSPEAAPAVQADAAEAAPPDTVPVSLEDSAGRTADAGEAQANRSPPREEETAPTPSAPTDAPTSQAVDAKLPRVVDLGADKCKACKELAPILVELRKEYAGRVVVEFIDVWKSPKAATPYKIRLIPTQIFFDRDGKEIWRHEGFLPKKDFIAKFAELGVK
ncbi:MAG TPA: thioredoxin domain-containing protein [Phycisphaerae bacterium]|nr:thioredoxin domain-containing protein [Phycisphaerae bacterium]